MKTKKEQPVWKLKQKLKVVVARGRGGQGGGPAWCRPWWPGGGPAWPGWRTTSSYTGKVVVQAGGRGPGGGQKIISALMWMIMSNDANEYLLVVLFNNSYT